jgi:hypothetical protein
MARVNVGDVVVLGERDFETRAGTQEAIYDILAVLSKKDCGFLIKNDVIPAWMLNSDEEASDDIFELEEENESSDENNETAKKNLKKRVVKQPIQDDDIDIDAI